MAAQEHVWEYCQHFLKKGLPITQEGIQATDCCSFILITIP